MRPDAVGQAPQPGLRRNARDVMRLLPRGARGAEVGSHAGRWTRALRDIAAPTSLTLIDPWAADAARDARALAYRAPPEAREAMARAVAAEFPDATILRQPSTEALRAMPDHSLDWLFLDGEKQYDVLADDLEQALRVVRPGGVVAGGGWHHGREIGWPVRAAVGEMADRLALTPHRAGQFWALAVAAAAPAPRPAQRGFLLVSTMKNEAPYILEWIAHHRALGFTDFLIFTNDCADTTTAMLDRQQEIGGVTHVANTVLRRGPHKSALKWARDHVAFHRAAWTMIADVDEFLSIPGHGTLPALLDALGPETDAVSFPWKIFGNAGVEAFDDRPITRQFTRCETAPDDGGRIKREVKTLFRHREAMAHTGLHRPRLHDAWKQRFVWKAPDGTDISARMNPGRTWTMPWSGAGACLHHYPLRSLEAYILKKDRGRANHVGEDLGRAYWDRWNMTSATDRTLAGGIPGFAEAHEGLMADRKLRRLHRRGVAWHRDRLAALLHQPAYRALHDDLAETLRGAAAA